jgi:hypothetical protein
MYLLRVNNLDELKTLQQNIECLPDFDYLDLCEVNSLTLSVIHIDYVNWISDNPIVNDEVNGLFLIQFDNICLEWFEQNADSLQPYGCNPEEVGKFTMNRSGLIISLEME